MRCASLSASERRSAAPLLPLTAFLLPPCSTQLLERCAVGDFTIKDLTAPTAKRFQANLSGILNFYFFEQDQGDRVLRPLEDEVEHLAAEEEQLMTENAELRERIEQEKCVSSLSRHAFNR